MYVNRQIVKLPRARIYRGTGWKGAYARKAPQGEHKCLPRSEMAKLLAKLK